MTGPTPPGRPHYGTGWMWLSWAYGAEAQAAADRVRPGAVGLGEWLNTVFNLSWGGDGVEAIEAHKPGLCRKSKVK